MRKGFTWGFVKIIPLLKEEEDEGSSTRVDIPYTPEDQLVIPFQNENIYAYLESPKGEKKVRHMSSQSCRLRFTKIAL